MNSQTFIDALYALEASRDIDTMTGMFADNAELRNPHLSEPLTGRDGARRFWPQYRDAFGDIRSEFRSVIIGDSAAALEWISDGTLATTGQQAHYGGVSVIEWTDTGIQRFATYFDPDKLRLSATTDAMQSERHVAVEDSSQPGVSVSDI